MRPCCLNCVRSWISGTVQTGDTVPENPTNDRQDPQGRRNPDYHRGTFPGAERQATSINHPGPVTK